ncbi:hypothetical protein KFK09_024555 [Dendrobium nobile]|uniref:Uncharacterized protein n=1 Tax=Dendrobium nobile TaxID=94219 RepID=A0A8T3AEB7_DENNO|nr:hypothetical protein KFK09_024555 [Dendrobium nobile]
MRTSSNSRDRLSLLKTLSVLEIGRRCGRFTRLTKSAPNAEKAVASHRPGHGHPSHA